MRHRLDPGTVAGLSLMFGLLCLCAALGVALAAGPSEKWGHDEDTSAWFRSLHNSYGTSCCDYVDGMRIDDVDYVENPDGSYEVHARDQWKHIEKERVLHGTNKVGYAILWWGRGNDTPYCFLPGARG
jgi:hypothetical protein